MNWQDIKNHLKIAPFQPFRVYISDGSTYDVSHPDFVLVSRTEVVIGVNPLDEDTPERLIYCDPLHITRIEPLFNGKKQSKSTGRKPKF